MAAENVMRLYLNGVAIGEHLSSINDVPVLTATMGGDIQKRPLAATAWSQIKALGNMSQTVVAEVEFPVDQYGQQLQHLDLWKRMARLYAQKQVVLSFRQTYTDINPTGTDITIPAAGDNELPMGTALCLTVNPGQLHGKSFVSLIFTFEVSEAAAMTADYILKNAQFLIMKSQNVPDETQPEDWVLNFKADTVGGEGVSRVPTDDNMFALYMQYYDPGNPIPQIHAQQEWTCPASAPAGQELALACEVQQRPRHTDATADAPDVAAVVYLSTINETNNYATWSEFRIGANMSAGLTLRHAFKPTPGTVYTLQLGFPVLTANAVRCAFLIKRVWLEITKAQ